MDLPQAIGSRVRIPSYDCGLRREVEARGFWAESGNRRYFVMRRDYPDGVLCVGDYRPARVFANRDFELIEDRAL